MLRNRDKAHQYIKLFMTNVEDTETNCANKLNHRKLLMLVTIYN